MKYEWAKECGVWFSRETVIDGTVRIILKELRFAENDVIYFDEPEYDVCTGKDKDSEKVVVWRLVEDHLC